MKRDDKWRHSLHNALELARWHLNSCRVLSVWDAQPACSKFWNENVETMIHAPAVGALQTACHTRAIQTTPLSTCTWRRKNSLLTVNVHQLQLEVTVALLVGTLKQKCDRVSCVLRLQTATCQAHNYVVSA